MASQHGQHWLRREDVGSVTVVRFRVPHLRSAELNRSVFQLLDGLVDEAGRRQLLLDLGGVGSLDSFAISKLVLLNRKAQAAGGRLALCCLTPGADEALEAMHLKEVVATYAGEAEALASFAPPAESESSGE